MRARIFSCFFLLLTAGCATSSLQELKTAAPKGTPFQASLAVRYLKFSDEKAAKYNWSDSSYFADKGLQAAYGHDVAPEDPQFWNLPEDKRDGLKEAHDELGSLLEAGVTEKNPEEAAAAQVFFDCWVENQSNDSHPDDIAYCRDNFEHAVKALAAEKVEAKPETPTESAAPVEEVQKSEEAPATAEKPAVSEVAEAQKPAEEAAAPEKPAEAAPEVEKAEEKPAAATERPVAAKKPAKTQKVQKPAVSAKPAKAKDRKPAKPVAPEPKKEAYIVFFGTGRDSLDPNGERLMDELVKELKKQGPGPYTLVVNGHTDLVGGKRYNFGLSKRRAQVVLQALAERGIPKKSLSAFGFGETDPVMPTKEGVPSQKNRRVEIYIGGE